MRKICRFLCIAISFVLLFNLSDLAVSAEGNVQESSDVGTPDGTVPGDPEGGDNDNDLNNDDPNDNDINNDDPNDNGTNHDIEDGKDVEKEPVKEPVQPEKYIKNLTVTSDGTSKIHLSWELIDPEAIGFSGLYVGVYSGKDRKEEQLVKEYKSEEPEKTELDIDGLKAGVTYYLSVIPFKEAEAPEGIALFAEGGATEGERIDGQITVLSAPVLSAKAAEGKVTLSWNKVSGASYYEVYDTRAKKTVTVSTNTITKTGLKNNVVYYYQVRAVAKDTDISAQSAWSKKVSAKPVVTVPGRVKNLKTDKLNKAIVLKWSKVSRATSYQIYRYNSKKRSWGRIATVKSTTYTNKGLKSGSTYKYKVRAIRSAGGATAYGSYSSLVSAKAQTYVSGSVHPIYYRAKVKKTTWVYSNSKRTKKARKVSKGTTVTITIRGMKTCKIRLKNGKEYYVATSRIKRGTSIYTTKDWPKSVKENFVNKKKYSSKSKYLIWISQYTQRVNIFQGKKGKWKLIRTGRVGTGTHIHPTPQGVFKVQYKEKGWFYRYTYEKPVVHFKGKISFHSRIKKYGGGYSDARIGKPVSSGCVRMYDSDIQWIYKKCPKGTTVVSY